MPIVTGCNGIRCRRRVCRRVCRQLGRQVCRSLRWRGRCVNTAVNCNGIKDRVTSVRCKTSNEVIQISTRLTSILPNSTFVYHLVIRTNWAPPWFWTTATLQSRITLDKINGSLGKSLLLYFRQKYTYFLKDPLYSTKYPIHCP